jgi:hypothetical protein
VIQLDRHTGNQAFAGFVLGIAPSTSNSKLLPAPSPGSPPSPFLMMIPHLSLMISHHWSIVIPEIFFLYL